MGTILIFWQPFQVQMHLQITCALCEQTVISLITFLHNYILFTLHIHSTQSMSNVLSVIQKSEWYEFNKVLCDRKDSLLTCTCSCGKHLSTGSYPYQFLDQHLLEEKGLLITNTMIYMCNPARKKFFLRFVLPTY